MLNSILAASRITGVAPAIEDIRNNPGQFRGLARTLFVPAEDGDIVARVSQRISAGGIYPDGAPAVVDPAPGLSLVAHDVVNFKRAFEMKPSQIAILARIVRAGGIEFLNGDPGLTSFAGFLRMALMQNRMGNYQRMENAVWGMWCDAYSYSKNGTVFTVTWGKPADLKPTALAPWSDPVNAKPVTDLLNLMRIATNKYGVTYNRVTLGSADLDLLTATAEFRAKTGAFVPSFLLSGAAGFPATDDVAMNAQLLGKALSKPGNAVTVEIFDESMPVVANDATTSFVRHLPLHKVLLSRTQDDGTGLTYDFGNATVLETAMQAIAAAINGASGSDMIGDLADVPERGPVSFAILQPGNTGLEVHDVLRGWPRMLQETATAVLTVG